MVLAGKRNRKTETDPLQADAEGDAGGACGAEGGRRGRHGLESAELVRVDGQREDVFHREGEGHGDRGGFREGLKIRYLPRIA